MMFLLEYQMTGVRSMTFNPDGRSLLCGLHESLKVALHFPHVTMDLETFHSPCFPEITSLKLSRFSLGNQ
jgi:hypothetical protein